MPSPLRRSPTASSLLTAMSRVERREVAAIDGAREGNWMETSRTSRTLRSVRGAIGAGGMSWPLVRRPKEAEAAARAPTLGRVRAAEMTADSWLWKKSEASDATWLGGAETQKDE